MIMKPKKLETENILVYAKSYTDFVIYSTRYDSGKTIKMLSLHQYKLMEKIKEHKGKKYLRFDDYVLNIELDRIKEIIDTEEFDNTQILIRRDDVLPGDITLKNAVVLMVSIIKDDGKFCPPPAFKRSIV